MTLIVLTTVGMTYSLIAKNHDLCIPLLLKRAFISEGYEMAHSQMAKLDTMKAFKASLEYDVKDIVFGDPKLKVLLDHHARKVAVEPRMFLPGLLGSTSNAMGTSKVILIDS